MVTTIKRIFGNARMGGRARSSLKSESFYARTMTANCPRLIESFLSSPVVDLHGYQYFVNPVSDGIPRMDRELLDEISDAIVDIADLDCDLILAPEAMGIPLAVGVTERTGIPYSVIRKRRYGLPGEIGLDQTTGYSESPMYINGVSPGDRVVILDDVISTGGTLGAISTALRRSEAVVTEAVVVFSKCPDLGPLSERLGFPIRHILTVSSEDGQPSILRV